MVRCRLPRGEADARRLRGSAGRFTGAEMLRDPASARWAMLSAVRVAGALAATLGVILVARAGDWPARALGVAIVLAALAMTGSVTSHLARRWRSPRP